MPSTKKKVWFITGASKGLGLSLTRQLLQQGYAVAATSRSQSALLEAVGDNKNFLPLQVDLTNEESIHRAVIAAHDHFDAIDVVVNNAGYGIGGAIEELTTEDIRSSFEINVFATMEVIKSVMPFMRARRMGHIINISSIAGFAAGVGWSVYAATKFAITGFSEVLAMDVKALGIKVTVVEPGAFRTSFLSDASLMLANNKIDEYADVRASHDRFQAMDGKQIGDPEKAAAVFIELAENPNPPVKLLLGSDAYLRATQKTDALKIAIEANKAISLSTDY